jgi:hypothetical protein
VFDLYGKERLIEWKKIRADLEHSSTPYHDVLKLWRKAPFVNPYIDTKDPDSWPDPWRLVLDSKYDNLAICLGMLYTLKLTERFMDATFEIHKSAGQEEDAYLVVVDGESVIDYAADRICSFRDIGNAADGKIWCSKNVK